MIAELYFWNASCALNKYYNVFIENRISKIKKDNNLGFKHDYHIK